MVLRRNVGNRPSKTEIVIVCEGKRTEPEYFRNFRSWWKNGLVTVTEIGGCGVPTSVVERAIQEFQERERRARKSRDSFDQNFEVWAVFDRDAHPHGQVPRAISNAERNSIKVAFSNPCFEVWGLMHFSPYSKPGHHHETQAELKRQLAGYCHEKNPIMDISYLMARYEAAVENSKSALAEREKEGNHRGDPSTTVHLLTERIRAGAGRP